MFETMPKEYWSNLIEAVPNKQKMYTTPSHHILYSTVLKKATNVDLLVLGYNGTICWSFRTWENSNLQHFKDPSDEASFGPFWEQIVLLALDDMVMKKGPVSQSELLFRGHFTGIDERSVTSSLPKGFNYIGALKCNLKRIHFQRPLCTSVLSVSLTVLETSKLHSDIPHCLLCTELCIVLITSS